MAGTAHALIPLLALTASCSAVDNDGLSGNAPGSQASAIEASLTVNLQTYAGNYLVADQGGGANLSASSTWARSWETFVLTDLNGGGLVSGDLVNLRGTAGQWVSADQGGGGTITVAAPWARTWETFRIIKLNGSGTINWNDKIALQTTVGGQYVSAVNGGGGAVGATAPAARTWETFTLQLGDPANVHFSSAGSGSGDISLPSTRTFLSDVDIRALGSVTLTNGSTTRCLSDDPGGLRTDPCDGTDIQKWIPYRNTFENLKTEHCLVSDEVGNVSAAACDRINPHMTWLPYGTTLVNAQTRRCLDSSDAGNTYALPCNGGPYQNWIPSDKNGSWPSTIILVHGYAFSTKDKASKGAGHDDDFWYWNNVPKALIDAARADGQPLNVRAANWDGVSSISASASYLERTLNQYCKGSQTCDLVGHSTGDAIIGYALDKFQGRGWNVRTVFVSGGAGGGTEGATALKKWGYKDPVLTDLEPQNMRGTNGQSRVYDQNMHGDFKDVPNVRFITGNRNWTGWEFVFLNNDGVVPFHSQAGVSTYRGDKDLDAYYGAKDQGGGYLQLGAAPAQQKDGASYGSVSLFNGFFNQVVDDKGDYSHDNGVALLPKWIQEYKHFTPPYKTSSRTREAVPRASSSPSLFDVSVSVCDDSNFGGTCQSLPPGTYDVSDIHNDTISSIRVPKGLAVTLYTDSGFRGSQQTFAADAGYVGDSINNKASSIKVEIGPAATVSLPSGSYTQSCSSCSVNGSTLSCNCNDPSGSPHSTSTSVSCAAGINNCNGSLTCGGCPPSGSYTQSCSSCSVNGSTLSCYCADAGGTRRSTSTSVNCGAGINNCGGSLTCGGCPPSGSYTKSCSSCTVNGSTLSCNCDDAVGDSHFTSTNVSCGAGINNCNGSLTCGGCLPSGTYEGSCYSCSSNGSTLTCACYTSRGGSIVTSLSLPCIGKVINNDGALFCVSN